MGQSTDAYLVYGIDLDEPDAYNEDGEFYEFWKLFEEAEDDPWEVISNLSGIEYVSGTDSYDRRSEFRQNFGVEIETHCYHEYPMYLAIIPNAGFSAARGDVTEIDPADMVITQGQLDDFKAGLEKLKIPYSEPKWMLVSYWH